MSIIRFRLFSRTRIEEGSLTTGGNGRRHGAAAEPATLGR